MTPIFASSGKPIPLPETPKLSRGDADIMFANDIPFEDWMAKTDQERADIRWNTGANRLSGAAS